MDDDREHATYESDQVETYFAAATQAALVLAEFRAPYRGRSTPVNAWWGTFDLAVAFFSGRPVEAPSEDFIVRNSADAEQIEIGWWPGDAKHGRAAFFALAHPIPDGFGDANLDPGACPLGRGPRASTSSIGTRFAISRTRGPSRSSSRTPSSDTRAAVCDWDPGLARSAEGSPPPVR